MTTDEDENRHLLHIHGVVYGEKQVLYAYMPIRIRLTPLMDDSQVTGQYKTDVVSAPEEMVFGYVGRTPIQEIIDPIEKQGIERLIHQDDKAHQRPELPVNFPRVSL
ncbi:MAG: hypothetical protein AABX51_00580 [Nanoarchaeota archaeon]